MDKVIRYLGRQSRLFVIISSFVMVLLLGGLDYLTGPEIFVPIFYLIPVSLAAWFGGGWAGVGISVASALTGLNLDLVLRSYSHPAIPYWNALVRLGFFLIATYTLTNLQAARRLREELQYFIVHDLGVPLGGIILALGTLQREIQEKNPSQQWLVKNAMASSQWMSTLINSLLDLARLENRQMPLQITEVKVKELMGLSLEQVALRAEQNQITLASELSVNTETIYVDHELTVRILVNLLGNAIKFSPAGSIVTIRVAPVETDMLAFSITDQGPGISEKWVGKVFDKFVQVQARRAGAPVGSGLGLTFCQLAVNVQGGHISLESSPGHGTTVTFTLPTTMRPSIETQPGLPPRRTII